MFRFSIIALAMLAMGWPAANSREVTKPIPNEPAAEETASYKVVERTGEFEIRDYPELQVVSTPLEGRGDDDNSFKKLFGFITGENTRQEKISMTTPVFIDREAEDKNMSFVLPKDTVEKGPPKPENPKVKLTTRLAGHYAVYRFEGKGTREEENEALTKLRAWIKERGLTAAGEPEVAYYDPPWRPAEVKRNEVLIPVQKGESAPAGQQ